MEIHSWTVDDEVAIKKLDFSAFNHNGTGITREVYEYFGIDDSDQDIILKEKSSHFGARLRWQTNGRGKSPSVRMFWDKTFTSFLKDCFPEWGVL